MQETSTQEYKKQVEEEKLNNFQREVREGLGALAGLVNRHEANFSGVKKDLAEFETRLGEIRTTKELDVFKIAVRTLSEAKAPEYVGKLLAGFRDMLLEAIKTNNAIELEMVKANPEYALKRLELQAQANSRLLDILEKVTDRIKK